MSRRARVALAVAGAFAAALLLAAYALLAAARNGLGA